MSFSFLSWQFWQFCMLQLWMSWWYPWYSFLCCSFKLRFLYVLLTFDVTEGAALKSVSNADLIFSHTVVSIPRKCRLSNQSMRSPLKAFLTWVTVCLSVHAASILWFRTFCSHWDDVKLSSLKTFENVGRTAGWAAACALINNWAWSAIFVWIEFEQVLTCCARLWTSFGFELLRTVLCVITSFGFQL